MKKTGIIILSFLGFTAFTYWLWAKFRNPNRQVTLNGQKTPATFFSTTTGTKIARQRVTLEVLYEKYLGLVQQSRVTHEADGTYTVKDETAGASVSGLVLNGLSLNASDGLAMGGFFPAMGDYLNGNDKLFYTLSQNVAGEYTLIIRTSQLENGIVNIVQATRQFGADGILKPAFASPDLSFYRAVGEKWSPYLVTDLDKYLSV